MSHEDDVNKFIEKVNKTIKEKKLDLSSDEDLSIGIMNLISIEEHLFFTAMKTENNSYLALLNEVREMRKELLKKIIKEYEGEVWCISKHLLAASMRMMEVGTKALGKGDKEEAKKFFEKAYKLYSMFWGIQLDMFNIKDKGDAKKFTKDAIGENYLSAEIKPEDEKDPNFMKKVMNSLKKAIDCCKE